jgi:hypothetical protein
VFVRGVLIFFSQDTHAKNEAETWVVNHTEQIEKSTRELAKLEKELIAEEKELEVIANNLKGTSICSSYELCCLTSLYHRQDASFP